MATTLLTTAHLLHSVVLRNLWDREDSTLDTEDLIRLAEGVWLIATLVIKLLLGRPEMTAIRVWKLARKMKVTHVLDALGRHEEL